MSELERLRQLLAEHTQQCTPPWIDGSIQWPSVAELQFEIAEAVRVGDDFVTWGVPSGVEQSVSVQQARGAIVLLQQVSIESFREYDREWRSRRP